MNVNRSAFQYEGSYLDFIIERTEQVHALVNRYTSPDEEAFFPDRISNAALLQAQSYPPVLHPNAININKKLLSIYTNRIVPGLCEKGDDRQYGSSAVCDTVVLQALSRRIHYGKFVAEAKFAADKENYSKRIKAQDSEWLMEALTVKRVEEMVLSRVELKASTFLSLL
jgi:chorismate mutase